MTEVMLCKECVLHKSWKENKDKGQRCYDLSSCRYYLEIWLIEHNKMKPEAVIFGQWRPWNKDHNANWGFRMLKREGMLNEVCKPDYTLKMLEKWFENLEVVIEV